MPLVLPGNKAPITPHTFGYGTYPQCTLLRNLRTVAHGWSYYFVENDSSVGATFSRCVGRGSVCRSSNFRRNNLTIPKGLYYIGAS